MEATGVNVAEILSVETNQTCVEKIKESIEENPVLVKALETAKTIEEVYDTMKNYVQVKFEDFKVYFEKSMSFYKESKAEIPDEVLDAVVGGGWWGNFWNKYKTAIIATAIVVGCIAGGAALGAFSGLLMGGVAGVAFGATAGTGLGAVAGVATAVTNLVTPIIE